MKLVHLLLGATMAMTIGADASAREHLGPEARIARITAGRQAGPPVDCIQLRNIRSSEIIDRTAIVYSMNDGTIYLNRPDNPTFLDVDDIMVNRSITQQLCSIDIVNLIDRNTRIPHGSIGLGEFEPYTKVRRMGSN